jgi:TonB family protein
VLGAVLVLGACSGAASTAAGPAAPDASDPSEAARLAPQIPGIVRTRVNMYRACYEAGLARNPRLTGRVVLRFVIGLDGLISNISTSGSDLPDPEVVRCVAMHFSVLVFPQPRRTLTVTYPFMFSPGPEDPQPARTRSLPVLEVLEPGQYWRCPFPPEAAAANVDEGVVTLRVMVRPDGSAESAAAVVDPGHGFGRAAQQCALALRFRPALDSSGTPFLSSVTINVRFSR